MIARVVEGEELKERTHRRTGASAFIGRVHAVSRYARRFDIRYGQIFK
jgi:hypothetical protein